MTNEELAANYKILLTKWEEASMEVEKQKKSIYGILQEKVKQDNTITDLEEEVALLNSKQENMTKSICMLDNGSDILDEILEVGKMSKIFKGIWFYPKSMSKKDTNHPQKLFLLRTKLIFRCWTTCHNIMHDMCIPIMERAGTQT